MIALIFFIGLFLIAGAKITGVAMIFYAVLATVVELS